MMRERISLDRGWRFHRGDLDYGPVRDKGPMYIQAKTERKLFGPAARLHPANGDSYSLDKEINPEHWDVVDLPHDYIVLGTPDEHENNALGYFHYDNAWYRKIFRLTKEDEGKRICIYFEGVATRATVYFNGCLMGHNFCGYTGFEIDITDYAEFDRDNVLAVYVNTEEHESWWYEGGGIYRHVWLEKTEKLACDRWGLYMIPRRIVGDRWSLTAENTIRNDSDQPMDCIVRTEVFEGEEAVLSMEMPYSVPAREKTVRRMQAELTAPHLWSCDDPYLYRAVTTVVRDGEAVDTYETPFGFRYYEFDPETGMKQNGKPVVIKGVSMHADFGLTGKAVPDNIQFHKIAILKEMGANGLRCSHYPHGEATMQALDEAGFITMAETRWFESTKEGMEQLEMLIKRDRNHPCILFWSVGNEEPKFITESGRRIAKTMISFVKKLDDTRLVISANDMSPDVATVYDELDAVGINYNLDKFDMVHEKYPEKPIFSSECCATGTTRGWYYDDNPAKGYINAIDKDTNSWFRGREVTWKFLRARPWILGGYQWIGIEHRGECMWPRLCSQSGAIDMFLQKKDAFYQNQSHWIEDRPILHLLPHWNWSGLEGEMVRVVAYTNCPAVELFVNGVSAGKIAVERYGHAEWSVPYVPGTIEAVAYGEDGGILAKDSHTTTGAPTALKLCAENIVPKANGADILLVTCSCVDSEGREVPDASPTVDFTTNALGKIVGTGSDVSDHEPLPMTVRKMRAGAISVAVKVGDRAGELKLYASADGLASACLTVNLD
ncbi:MAG: DUF4982 domain-containing protein [Clostridia bacterium]|nr:DUF4982 domain-containing protein [Clostridia bacterium]